MKVMNVESRETFHPRGVIAIPKTLAPGLGALIGDAVFKHNIGSMIQVRTTCTAVPTDPAN